MRILNVVTAATYGGAVRHVLDLSQEMKRAGHVVAVVSSPEARTVAECRRRGVTFFPNAHFRDGIAPFHDVCSLIVTSQIVCEFRPDLIAGHSTKAGLIARMVAFMFGKPAVFTAHGWGFAEDRYPGSAWLIRGMERLAAHITRHVICVSESDCRLARTAGISSAAAVTRIPNGILVPEESRCAVRRDGDASTKPLVAIMVARMGPPKDFTTLLQAVARVPGLKLMLVGDGPMAASVESQIQALGVEDRTELLGDRMDVPALLSSADIFVLSSMKEGFPYAILEAMAAELPVVATRVGGVPEMIQDGVPGYLVPPRDVDALSTALCRLAGDPVLRRRMGKAARERVAKEFRLEVMVSRTLKIYESIVRNVGRRPLPNRAVRSIEPSGPSGQGGR